jgi:hypothetical protein
MILIKLSDLRPIAMKHAGMWQAFLRMGEMQGDRIAISRENFEQLNAYYFPGKKWGSIVHELLTPGVKVIDSLLGTNLAECGACAARELSLNDRTNNQ